MYNINLETKKDFDKAVLLIETYDKSSNRKIKYYKSDKQPDLTKPYTDYDSVKFGIYADEKVIEILDKDKLKYNIDQIECVCQCPCPKCSGIQSGSGSGDGKGGDKPK